jgi:hypothetical protein
MNHRLAAQRAAYCEVNDIPGSWSTCVKTLFWKRSASGLDSPAIVANAFESVQPRPRRQELGGGVDGVG